MIKVIIADDHQLFIDGLRVLLEKETDIEVVGEANNGQRVLDLVDEKDVDIVILDVEMPELDGIETTRWIRKKHKQTKVLVLSMYDKKEFIIKLMRNGASGYILKNKSKEELITALRNVAAGRTHFSLEIMEKAIATSDLDEDEDVQLTDREIEVLKKIAEGHSSKSAADLLNISETTVNTHRRNILAKLDLPNTAHLVRYAIKHGYVEA